MLNSNETWSTVEMDRTRQVDIEWTVVDIFAHITNLLDECHDLVTKIGDLHEVLLLAHAENKKS